MFSKPDKENAPYARGVPMATRTATGILNRFELGDYGEGEIIGHQVKGERFSVWPRNGSITTCSLRYQLCSGGPTVAMASRVIRRLGKSWAHAHYVRNRQNCRQGCCWGFFIKILSSIPNRRFRNASGFSIALSHLLRIAALMASLAAFGRTFEANRFA